MPTNNRVNKNEDFKLYVLWGLLALFILNMGSQIVYSIVPQINESLSYFVVAGAVFAVVKSGVLDNMVSEEEYE